MPAETSALVDLLDLKMLPAWVKEPTVTNSEHRGEEDARLRRGERAPRTRRNRMREAGPQHGRADFRQDRQRPLRQRRERNRTEQPAPPSMVVRFLPEPRACENVGAQIKADALAYSLFSLARLFLQKPERYDVHLQTRPESPLFQLGENGPISVDRQFLENNAFRFVQKDFYKIDITQTEPIKGNFTSVARDPLSGTLLGPTNHHSYQPRLRSLYEQRFSRRMTFADSSVRLRSWAILCSSSDGKRKRVRSRLTRVSGKSRRSPSAAPPKPSGIFAQRICQDSCGPLKKRPSTA